MTSATGVCTSPPPSAAGHESLSGSAFISATAALLSARDDVVAEVDVACAEEGQHALRRRGGRAERGNKRGKETQDPAHFRPQQELADSGRKVQNCASVDPESLSRPRHTCDSWIGRLPSFRFGIAAHQEDFSLLCPR